MLFLLFLGTAFAQTVTYSMYSPGDGSGTIGSCQELVFDDTTCDVAVFGKLSDALTTSGWSQGACSQSSACPQAILDLMGGLDLSGIYGMYCTNGGSDLTFNFNCEASSSSASGGNTDCSLDNTCGDSCSSDPTSCAELQTMANGCASSCSQCVVDRSSDQLGCVGDERATAGCNFFLP